MAPEGGAANALLEAVGTRTVAIDDGKLRSYEGGWQEYVRVREERRSGMTPQMAIQAGYERAFGTILDSHVTTLVAGALMFWLGEGPIKGFAVTLSIGGLTSLFSAILVTRLQIVTWLRRTRPKLIPI